MSNFVFGFPDSGLRRLSRGVVVGRLPLQAVGVAAVVLCLALLRGLGVGMTFTTQVGYYIKSGSLVWFKIDILLSAKGSSTGVASVSGLPFTADTLGSLHSAATVGYVDGLSSVSGGICAIVGQGTKTIGIYQTTTGTIAQLTNSNLTNTSRLIISGTYSV